MEKQELKDLIAEIQTMRCETNRIELKKAATDCPKKLYDTLSSFSNQDSGGVIVFGIDESDYSISGVYDPADLAKKVNQQCTIMSPVVRPVITCVEIDGKQVVSAEIPGVPYVQRPVFYSPKGKIKGSYIRCGESDEPMTEGEIYSFEAFRQRAHDDEQICAEDLSSVMKYLDHERLHNFIAKCRENRPNFSKHFSDDELLESVGVLKKGKPTLAGLLVFSEVPQLYFPDLAVIAYAVPGIVLGELGTGGERFTANKRIEGSLASMLDDALKFVRMNTRNRIIIDREGNRVDDGEYPQIAVREAVLNALMHRDYSRYSLGTPVQIAIFQDRMEITSPGTLYGTSSVEHLGRIRLETRNSRLAILLETTGVAEHRHSGIITIRKECAAAGLPEPIFLNKEGEFKVIFRNNLSAASPLSQPMTAFVPTPIQQKVLDFCVMPRTRKEIAQHTGLSTPHIRTSIIQPLVENGLLLLGIPDKPRSRLQTYVAAPDRKAA